MASLLSSRTHMLRCVRVCVYGKCKPSSLIKMNNPLSFFLFFLCSLRVGGWASLNRDQHHTKRTRRTGKGGGAMNMGAEGHTMQPGERGRERKVCPYYAYIHTCTPCGCVVCMCVSGGGHPVGPLLFILFLCLRRHHHRIHTHPPSCSVMRC